MRKTSLFLPLPAGIKKWGFETQRSVGGKEDETFPEERECDYHSTLTSEG